MKTMKLMRTPVIALVIAAAIGAPSARVAAVNCFRMLDPTAITESDINTCSSGGGLGGCNKTTYDPAMGQCADCSWDCYSACEDISPATITVTFYPGKCNTDNSCMYGAAVPQPPQWSLHGARASTCTIMECGS